jgi:hypothetical protein
LPHNLSKNQNAEEISLRYFLALMSLGNIQEKLPQLREWIERTLARHRIEARSVASQRFPRLKDYFPSVFLETAFVVIVPRIPIPPLREMGLPELAEFEKGDYTGITYRNTYFVREGGIYNESIHFHELVHIVQWLYLGVDGFLTNYAAGLVEHGYENNPLEVMAREFQNYFDQGGPPKDIKSLIRGELPKIPKPV